MNYRFNSLLLLFRFLLLSRNCSFCIGQFSTTKKNHYASNDDRKFFSFDAWALFEQLCTLRMTAFDDRIKLKFINISLFIYFFCYSNLDFYALQLLKKEHFIESAQFAVRRFDFNCFDLDHASGLWTRKNWRILRNYDYCVAYLRSISVF